MWVNPVIQESRNKNSCVKTYSELYRVPEVLEKFNAKQLEEFGLDTNDFARLWHIKPVPIRKLLTNK